MSFQPLRPPFEATQPPYSNTGVRMRDPSVSAPLQAPEAAFFDWYQATIAASPEAIQAAFLETFHGEFEPVRPINGYASGVKHSTLPFSVFWGGHNPHPNVKATGGDSDQISKWVRCVFAHHRVSRADVALDFSFDGSFDAIAALIEPVARQRRVSIKFLGDPAENDPAYPADQRRGRTLYLGSQTSEMRIRLYEKGFERRSAGVETIDPNHARLEVVCAPQKERKMRAAELSPFEMIGFSKWISSAVELVCAAQPHLIPKVPARETTDDERLASCVRQYGRTLREIADRKGLHGLMAHLQILLYAPAERLPLPPLNDGATQ
uniref:Replication initiation protein-like C-terminal domain-containing protein n=1 Tax=uncultured prokaryote TaxID=198431 RepID=A0A0H5QMA7_9ZZZZ|nr:hypothetical protein [uncultured prokaryote]